MNIYQYTAYNNPLGAKKIINHYGQQAIKRPDILARQLASCVVENGKEALMFVCEMHPDYKLITDYTEYKAKQDAEKLKANNPFASAEGEELLSAVKNIKSEKPVSSKSEKTELLIIGGVVVVALALIMKK